MRPQKMDFLPEALGIGGLVQLFLPQEAEKFFRALHRQRHQVCVVRILIAGNRQQRAFHCDREPPVVHSNQELNNFPRRVTPRLRTNVLHFRENRRPRFSL